MTIELTPLRPDDSATLFEWINNREQVLLSSAYRPVSLAQHQEWFNAIQRRSDTVIFAIRLRNPDTLIGTCQLHSIDWVARRAELQIRLGDVEARGRGYGTDAVRRLVAFGFGDLNLHRIDLHVFADNVAAQRAYQKAGFVQEARLREAAYVNGKYIDVIVMAILNG